MTFSNHITTVLLVTIPLVTIMIAANDGAMKRQTHDSWENYHKMRELNQPQKEKCI
jgi:hypothetical protein